VIFGLFVHFRFDIPATSRIRILLFSVTDKVVTYILGLQLLFANYPASLASGVPGIVAGLLFRSSPFIQHWCKPPKFLSTLIRIIFSPPRNQLPAPSGYAAVQVRFTFYHCQFRLHSFLSALFSSRTMKIVLSSLLKG
jgi:hypothetical protein